MSHIEILESKRDGHLAKLMESSKMPEEEYADWQLYVLLCDALAGAFRVDNARMDIANGVQHFKQFSQNQEELAQLQLKVIKESASSAVEEK